MMFMISLEFSRKISASRMCPASGQIIQPVRSPCKPSALLTDPVVMPRA
ncbi:MAG: hypothetical protein ACD_54C00118G0001 [uncultured bacterium]|nr:MAG: hypothetical protein ACD_54C00118G0001 [uncultured bacterium]